MRQTQRQKCNWRPLAERQHEKLREAERAWYEYFGLCEVGSDRERVAEVYENVRTAIRL